MTKTTNRTILVVEDEALLLQTIVKKLLMAGFNAVEASSADQALDKLQKLSTPPDAIWLDYYLGESDGLDLMNQIKKNQLWKDIPVIVVSNSASEEKIHSMLALGANKYVLKAEHRLDEIVQLFEEFINNNQKGK